MARLCECLLVTCAGCLLNGNDNGGGLLDCILACWPLLAALLSSRFSRRMGQVGAGGWPGSSKPAFALHCITRGQLAACQCVWPQARQNFLSRVMLNECSQGICQFSVAAMPAVALSLRAAGWLGRAIYSKPGTV